MAIRFVYVPIKDKPFVRCVPVEFTWEKGMALSQRQKSAVNLHTEAIENGIATKLLECSRASWEERGYWLSAFNLRYFDDVSITVENVYQGSKVFQHKDTGKYYWLEHLYKANSMTAKKEPILKDSLYEFKGFKLFNTGLAFPSSPKYIFYNYIYIKSLMAVVDQEDIACLTTYDGFTDTMLRWYNGKITPCQAY